MPKLTVAASFARALMDFATSRGADRTALSERSLINPAELQNDDDRIDFARYVALMRAGIELCDDPALALHFGEAIDVTEISPWSTIGTYSDTIAEGFAQFNRYARLNIEVEGAESGGRFGLTPSKGSFWLIDRRANPNDFPELTESTFARMVCSCKRSMGGEEIVKEVHVTHAAPSYRAEYDRIFCTRVFFESDKNALLFSTAAMPQRPPFSSRPVHAILTAHAEMQLSKLESTKSARGRVEELLASTLHTGDARVDAIARTLGLSRQSLFRQLKAEGVTFERVLDELRFKIALRCLTEEKASVRRTARLVGFSEPSAFSRAFKRWTGVSPRNYLAKGGQ